MSILRLKQAQLALSDGRLDEAYDLARNDSFVTHRAGQDLINDLAGRLAERGQTHFQAGRLQQALSDCDKAQKLAGNTEPIVHLRQSIVARMGNQQEQGRYQAARLKHAQRYMDNGQLSVGQQILEDCDDPAAELLKLRVNGDRLALEDVREKAGQALKRGDLVTAIELILRTAPSARQNGKLSEILVQTKQQADAYIRDKLSAGRIDLAQALLQRLGPLVAESLELQDTQHIIEQCQQAARWLHQGRPRQALPILEQLRTMLPEAQWLVDSLTQTRNAAEHIDLLMGSPLGLLKTESSTATSRQSAPENKEVVIENHVIDTNQQVITSESSLPESFIMRVDGVGSYLVLRSSRISIGPVSHAQRPDIALVTGADCPVALIERMEEDYFIHCSTPIQVNDQLVQKKLLTNGDRVSLSPRCRFAFRRPSPASTSAKLEFTSARLPNPDIRQAILMDREIVLGNSAAAHVAHADCPASCVLYARNDGLACRTDGTVTVKNKPLKSGANLPFGESVEIGNLSLVLRDV